MRINRALYRKPVPHWRLSHDITVLHRAFKMHVIRELDMKPSGDVICGCAAAAAAPTVWRPICCALLRAIFKNLRCPVNAWHGGMQAFLRAASMALYNVISYSGSK